MKRIWLKVSVVAVLSVASSLAVIPQAAHAQVVAIAAGVWGWRNIVAPRIGGPFVAPEIRFRPFAGVAVYDAPLNLPAPSSQAQLVLNVPDPNAQVWIQGVQIQGNGRQRIYASPPLESGFDYTYEIRVRWRQNEQTNDQTRSVPIRAGQQAVVDFARPLGE